MHSTTFEAIGTQWTIQVHDDMSTEKWAALVKAISRRIEHFDKIYSRFRDDSLITEMGKNGGRYPMPEDGYELLSLYERLYRVSGGAVTPLIGQVMTDIGYDADYSFRTERPTKPPAWEMVIDYSPSRLILHGPALLDFGCAGKGYLVDRVAAMIAEAGMARFTVDAGGDLLHRGPDIKVGLENPHDSSEAIGTIQLGNRSLCASSGSRRSWGGYHHIVNPASLSSPDDILATWVIADNTATADGLATALFFTDPATLAKDFRFSYAVLRSDMSLERDAAFPADIYEVEPA